MRGPKCTIDSSCVIALDHLDLLPQLSLLFSRVLLPKAVRADIFKRRTTKDRVQALLDTYAFLERCDDYDQGAVDLLLIDRARKGMEDRGEAEAVVQASQTGAIVIVDDQWGRELASKSDLDHHGTLWVLRRFYELGLLTSAELRRHFRALRSRGIRLPWNIIDEYLTELGADPLGPE